MSIPSPNPLTVQTRLRRSAMQVIVAGLRFIEPECWKKSALSCSPSRGTYDASSAAVARRLRRELSETLATGLRSHRVLFDHIEIAACALGVRLAGKAIRSGLTAAPEGWSELAESRLLARLEVLRKRAKRLALAADAREYAERSARWRQLCHYLRAQLEGTRFTALGQLARRRHKLTLDIACDLTRRELRADGIALPEDRTLRRFVSQVLRNIRRGSYRPSIKDVLDRTLLAARFLATKVKRRLAALQPPTPKSTGGFHEAFQYHPAPQGAQEP